MHYLLYPVVIFLMVFLQPGRAKECLPIAPPADQKSFATDWMPLGNAVADLEEKVISPGHITDVGTPQIRFFFPSGWKKTDDRPALCIFPGGAYFIQAIDKEGNHIAQWAADHGMVGIVVKYRVSSNNNTMGRFPGPLLDARQAVRLTRFHAGELGINPEKIGVIGFSAGGHLASMTATLWNKSLPEEQDNPLRQISARPDFAMLIYPVITMNPDLTHSGTSSKILGPHADAALIDLCSTERQVNKQSPPMFLTQTKDDGVSCKNSELMEQACLKQGVPAQRVLYETGGHGYGMEKRGQPSDQWPSAAEQWLQERGILPTAKP